MQHAISSRSSLSNSIIKSISTTYLQRLLFSTTTITSSRANSRVTKILPKLRRSNQTDLWNQLINASSELVNNDFKPVNAEEQLHMRSTQTTYIWTLMESLKEIDNMQELEKISEALEKAIAFNLDRVLAPKPRRALSAWQFFMRDYRVNDRMAVLSGERVHVKGAPSTLMHDGSAAFKNLSDIERSCYDLLEDESKAESALLYSKWNEDLSPDQLYFQSALRMKEFKVQKARRRIWKDSGRPDVPLLPYILFSLATRAAQPDLFISYGQKTGGKQVKMLGDMWNALDPELKQVYVDDHAEATVIYKEQMVKWELSYMK